MNYQLEIETENGLVRLWFENIQSAMERIGAANLAVLGDWRESLETQSFESSAGRVTGKDGQK